MIRKSWVRILPIRLSYNNLSKLFTHMYHCHWAV